MIGSNINPMICISLVAQLDTLYQQDVAVTASTVNLSELEQHSSYCEVVALVAPMDLVWFVANMMSPLCNRKLIDWT